MTTPPTIRNKQQLFADQIRFLHLPFPSTRLFSLRLYIFSFIRLAIVSFLSRRRPPIVPFRQSPTEQDP